jgi:hypothetical protein
VIQIEIPISLLTFGKGHAAGGLVREVLSVANSGFMGPLRVPFLFIYIFYPEYKLIFPPLDTGRGFSG